MKTTRTILQANIYFDDTIGISIDGRVIPVMGSRLISLFGFVAKPLLIKKTAVLLSSIELKKNILAFLTKNKSNAEEISIHLAEQTVLYLKDISEHIHFNQRTYNREATKLISEIMGYSINDHAFKSIIAKLKTNTHKTNPFKVDSEAARNNLIRSLKAIFIDFYKKNVEIAIAQADQIVTKTMGELEKLDFSSAIKEAVYSHIEELSKNKVFGSILTFALNSELVIYLPSNLEHMKAMEMFDYDVNTGRDTNRYALGRALAKDKRVFVYLNHENMDSPGKSHEVFISIFIEEIIDYVTGEIILAFTNNPSLDIALLANLIEKIIPALQNSSVKIQELKVIIDHALAGKIPDSYNKKWEQVKKLVLKSQVVATPDNKEHETTYTDTIKSFIDDYYKTFEEINQFYGENPYTKYFEALGRIAQLFAHYPPLANYSLKVMRDIYMVDIPKFFSLIKSAQPTQQPQMICTDEHCIIDQPSAHYCSRLTESALSYSAINVHEDKLPQSFVTISLLLALRGVVNSAPHSHILQTYVTNKQQSTNNQPKFSYGRFNNFVSFDENGEPTFVYEVFDSKSKVVGTMELYGQPIICEGKNGRNNILKTTGELSNFNITRNMNFQEVCRVLPPTLFDKVVMRAESVMNSAFDGAQNGAIRGGANVIGFMLQTKGVVSKQIAHYLSQCVYFTGFFVLHFNHHLQELEKQQAYDYLSAAYKAAVDTGHMLLTQFVITYSCQLLNQAGESLVCNSWKKTGSAVRALSSFAQRFGMFGYNTYQHGVINASASVAAGALTQTTIEEAAIPVIKQMM